MSTDTDSMEDKTPIKYLIIGDTSNNKLIAEFSSGNAQPKTKKEINQIFNKLCKSQNKKFDERNKITSKNENYYFTFCRPDLLYIILSNNTYPERYIFELIHKINDERIYTMVNDETRELNPSGRQQLKQLIDYYQDPKNMNKIAEIQSEVDSLKIDMRDNINKMVDSVDNVNELQGKTEALKFETDEYKDQSIQVRKITWWQNLKLWIILGIVVLIIIILIILLVT
jgi:vesicle-associated membrane protein 7